MSGVRYRVRLPAPHTHLVHVEVEADGVTEPARLVMPSWTPGSYLLREFPRNVQSFAAADGAGRALAWAKADKNTWRVDAPADGRLRASYVVYANELTVRTSHVDASHACLNGASVFVALAGREHEPVALEIEAPEGWRATTSLPQGAHPLAFTAADFDELVDAPIEVGTHALLEWEIDGVPHRWAIWGRGNWDGRRLVADTTRIVRAAQGLWGPALPYRSYTFLLHLAPGGGGGLEHRESTHLLAERFAFRGPGYENFLGLVAHEHFHAWNGKRIRPAVLGPFDYTREAYTRELWVVEGFTTYYTDLILRRANLMPPPRYLDKVAEQVTRWRQLPGRRVQSLEESSFDAWIKFYRPDAHTPNAQVSYYMKGALVALLLDLTIRAETDGARSLDDVLRTLWARFGARDVGFPEGEVERVLSEVAGVDLSPRLDRWLRSTEELELDEVLGRLGLMLMPVVGPPGMPGATVGPMAGPGPMPAPPTPPAPGAAPAAPGLPAPRGEPNTGLAFKLEGIRLVVSQVLDGSPAHRAGVNAGDELVAVDGFRCTPEVLNGRIAESEPGTTLPLHLFRRDELLRIELPVEHVPPARFRLQPAPGIPPEQLRLVAAWLHAEFPPMPGMPRPPAPPAAPVPPGSAG